MTSTTPGGSTPTGATSFRFHPDPWIAFRPALDAMLDPLGRSVLARSAPTRWEHVLDVGCGCGSTTVALGAAVGPEGAVTAIDPSGAVLEVARDAIGVAGLTNVELIEGDAGTHPFAPHAFDLIYSRFGTMFFGEPEAAFANLHRALAAGGRMGFVCWRSIEENEWTTEIRDAASTLVPLPAPPPTDVPGPFSLARADRISEILSHTGFVDVTIDPLDREVLIGRGDTDEAIEFYLRLLPTGYLMFEPDRHLLDRLRATLRTVLEAHRGDDGIWLGSASWLVQAR